MTVSAMGCSGVGSGCFVKNPRGGVWDGALSQHPLQRASGLSSGALGGTPKQRVTQEGGGWKGPVEVLWSKASAQAGSLRAGCPGARPGEFGVSPRSSAVRSEQGQGAGRARWPGRAQGPCAATVTCGLLSPAAILLARCLSGSFFRPPSLTPMVEIHFHAGR